MKRLLYLMRKFQTFHRYNVCSNILFSILLIKNVKFTFKIFNNTTLFPLARASKSEFRFIYFQNGQFLGLGSMPRFLLTNRLFCLKPQLRLKQYYDLSTSRRCRSRPAPRW